jgi:adenosine deaminase
VIFGADLTFLPQVCLTSNVQTKAIAKLEDHPIRHFYDSGIIVVPGTDNVSVSKVTLSGEYLLIHNVFNFNVEEIVHLIDSTLPYLVI